MTAALADHLDQATPGMFIVPMCLEMFCQLNDAGGE
jgi:hypothetical protein